MPGEIVDVVLGAMELAAALVKDKDGKKNEETQEGESGAKAEAPPAE